MRREIQPVSPGSAMSTATATFSTTPTARHPPPADAVAGASSLVDRYAVVIPPGTRGPVAVTAAVYYQTLEAVVAEKFLGNLMDTSGDLVLEACVLGGPWTGAGRRPSRPWSRERRRFPRGAKQRDPDRRSGARPGASPVRVYPLPGAARAYKTSWSRPSSPSR